MSEPFTAPAGSLPSFIQLADPDVVVRDLHPTLLGVLTAAGHVHSWLFHKVLVITSGNDGQHAPGSAHYKNRAFDLRTRDKTELEQAIFLQLLNYLAATRGSGVFDERQRGYVPHFHVELLV